MSSLWYLSQPLQFLLPKAFVLPSLEVKPTGANPYTAHAVTAMPHELLAALSFYYSKPIFCLKMRQVPWLPPLTDEETQLLSVANLQLPSDDV